VVTDGKLNAASFPLRACRLRLLPQPLALLWEKRPKERVAGLNSLRVMAIKISYAGPQTNSFQHLAGNLYSKCTRLSEMVSASCLSVYGSMASVPTERGIMIHPTTAVWSCFKCREQLSVLMAPQYRSLHHIKQYSRSQGPKPQTLHVCCCTATYTVSGLHFRYQIAL
jgi:hypothetical protein